MNANDGIFEGELLAEFGPPRAEAWHEELSGDIGDDWRERLRFSVGEGVEMLALYRAEDLDGVPTGVAGARAGWSVRHDLATTTPDEAAAEATRVLEGGAEALGLSADLLAHDGALEALLADVDPAETALHVHGLPDQAHRLFDVCDDPRGSLLFDPAARRLRNGDASEGDATYREFADLVQDAADRAPAFRLVTADARVYDGAGPVVSLAFALAALSEHFARLTDAGVPAETVAAHAQVVLPVGTRFFVEVARLRALRRLFSQLATAYGADEDARPHLYIQAQTAWRAVSRYDPHLNLLRGATAGAAAAVVGGADGVAVHPFDAAQATPGAFGQRLALNAQHILREEAYLEHEADPAAGSYFAEMLTDRLARSAWERFQQIEADGGLLAALDAGHVQEHLADARDARRDALARRERVRVGTNHYPNLSEERLSEERLSDDATRNGGGFRETAAFERLRLATERHARRNDAKRPAAFLLPVGAPKVRSARANFARNALGCGGFRALESTGFASVEDGVRAAAKAVADGEAHLVACAAPDADYAALLPALREALDARDIPIVAVARPDTLSGDAHADALLYRGVNLLGTLEALQARLGIEPIED